MDKKQIILIVAAGILILIILDQVLKAVGLKKDKSDKKREEAVKEIRTNEFFDPLYYKGKAFSALGKSPADKYAKDIHNAVKGFGTDEEALYATFGKLKCKLNISEIAESYYSLFKADMLTDILNDLSEKELATLNSIIATLPVKS